MEIGTWTKTSTPSVYHAAMTNPINNEAALLASLGSTTADASIYESSVLRDAKLRSAPKIELPHAQIARAIAANSANSNALYGSSSRSGLVPCGDFGASLPNLMGMAPSSTSSSSDGNRQNNSGGLKTNGNRAKDVPYILKVLSKVRQNLHTAQNNHDTNNLDEESRKRTIDVLHMKEQLCLSYLSNVAGISDEDGIIPVNPYINNKGKRRRRMSDGGMKLDAADHYYGVPRDNRNDDNDDSMMDNAKLKKASTSQSSSSLGKISRLDQIKNGQQFNQTNNNTTNNTKQARKRNTIMSLKSQMRIDNGLTPLKSMEEERYDAEQSLKRREERKKRRLRRQRELLGLGSESEEEEEAEFVEEEKDGKKVEAKKSAGILKGKSVVETSGEVPAKRSGVRWAEGEEATSNTITTSTTKRTTTKVYCPICESILIFNNEEGEDTPDAFLSRHIAQCQQSSGSRRRTRTSRRKKRVVNYADDDLDETEDAEEVGDDTAMEKMGIDSNPPTDDEESPRTQKKATVYNPTSIDDMDEFDYEDRTEYWAKYGLKQMSVMAEQDSTEVAPGAEVYDGGLEVPAWVNDRLFPYQRVGLRWMWELHCQGAGGVVGDEMGLGKTVQVSSFLGAMAANRFLDSVLIVAPATMLAHWLSELAVWAPGLRRIMMHRSGESDGASRVVSKGMLRSLQKWLKNARADRVNEAIDEDDYHEKGADSFCGTGYAIVTTYESIRRSSDEWVNHNWSYVVLDEGQKIRNPDADVTLACKRLRTPHRLLLSG